MYAILKGLQKKELKWWHRRFIQTPEEDEVVVRRACETICSSFRAELVAIEAALETLLTSMDPEVVFNRTGWVLTDSQSAISDLKQGPESFSGKIGDKIWSHIKKLDEHSTKTWYSSGYRDTKEYGQATKRQIKQLEKPLRCPKNRSRLTLRLLKLVSNNS